MVEDLQQSHIDLHVPVKNNKVFDSFVKTVSIDAKNNIYFVGLENGRVLWAAPA